ncbi:MAG: hypothetical protein J4F50_05825, partial [Acidimicrobiia bacterium]|nr:hypothetical protein [Acidimicrobiia bacterium]
MSGETLEFPASSAPPMDSGAAAEEEGENAVSTDGPGSSGAHTGDDQERVGALRFFQERSPTNNREATAVAAFYLTERAPTRDRSTTITKELLGDVFRQAQWKLPKRTDQTLV